MNPCSPSKIFVNVVATKGRDGRKSALSDQHIVTRTWNAALQEDVSSGLYPSVAILTPSKTGESRSLFEKGKSRRAT